MVEYSEELIIKYSKKIFGFCMSKTKDAFDAEDLSQEILMNLYEVLKKEQKIHNLDAYIYKLCFYSWSNYVRRNINYWRLEKSDLLAEIKDESKIEDDGFISEIRKRIAYLSGLNQKIITMYYYDNYKLVEIAKLLNVNENTVRTNLKRTRTKIKEKIMMTNSLHYKPIQLSISHNGNMGRYDNLLNLLGQNILYSCYKEAKTIEEIAEDVQVATCYLEEYLYSYLYLDWIKFDKNKYQTNFFISDLEYELNNVKVMMNKVEDLAVKIYEVCVKNFDRFKTLVNNPDFSDEALMWFFVGYFSQYLWGKFHQDYINNNLNTNFMLRKDGYKYSLHGNLVEDIKIDDEKLRNYYYNHERMITNRLYGRIYRGLTISKVNSNIDLNSIKDGANALIYDTYELELIYEIINSKRSPNEREKNILTKYIKEEVIKIVDGKPKWNVIFLENDAAKIFYEYLDEMKSEFDVKLLEKFLKDNKEANKQYIPKHLGKEMIEYYSSGTNITSFALYYLYDHKYLKLPKRNECKTASEWFYIYE